MLLWAEVQAAVAPQYLVLHLVPDVEKELELALEQVEVLEFLMLALEPVEVLKRELGLEQELVSALLELVEVLVLELFLALAEALELARDPELVAVQEQVQELVLEQVQYEGLEQVLDPVPAAEQALALAPVQELVSRVLAQAVAQVMAKGQVVVSVLELAKDQGLELAGLEQVQDEELELALVRVLVVVQAKALDLE